MSKITSNLSGSYKNSKIYYISSERRLAGTNSNFSYELKIPLGYSPTHVCLLSCQIPKSFYSISSGNNTFELIEDEKRVFITLSPGNYKLRVFVSVLEDKLNALSPSGFTYTVSYPSYNDVDDGKLRFVVTGNNTTQPAIRIIGSELHMALGFDKESVNYFEDDFLQSKNVINLQKPGNLYIISDICTDNESNILESIYGSSYQDYSMITYEVFDVIANAKKISHTKSNVYNFQLVDSSFLPIDLNGQHMNLVISLIEMNVDADEVKTNT